MPYLKISNVTQNISTAAGHQEKAIKLVAYLEAREDLVLTKQV